MRCSYDEGFGVLGVESPEGKDRLIGGQLHSVLLGEHGFCARITCSLLNSVDKKIVMCEDTGVS